MPRATVVVTPDRRELTTLPAVDGQEAGWVELRRLSWGEKLRKDAEAMRMKFVTNAEPGKDMEAEIGMVNYAASILEFAKCIVDHNLDDGGDPDTDPPRPPRKLDLRKEADIQTLDPRVGQEISDLIGEMNDFERKARKSEVDKEGK
jgi:hypothetical protein